MTHTTFIQPNYRRTSRPPVTIDGVTFASYNVGISALAMISDNGQIFIRRNYQRMTYYASVIYQGKMTQIGNKFRSEKSAARAAVKEWNFWLKPVD